MDDRICNRRLMFEVAFGMNKDARHEYAVIELRIQLFNRFHVIFVEMGNAAFVIFVPVCERFEGVERRCIANDDAECSSVLRCEVFTNVFKYFVI